VAEEYLLQDIVTTVVVWEEDDDVAALPAYSPVMDVSRTYTNRL
jgi:hypothetical protein